MASSVQRNAGQIRPQAEAGSVAHHGGHRYTSRPEAQSKTNVAAALLMLNACVLIAGIAMWCVDENSKVGVAGKFMFAGSFSIFGLIVCGVGINHFRKQYAQQEANDKVVKRQFGARVRTIHDYT
jgi:hypothetical protein